MEIARNCSMMNRFLILLTLLAISILPSCEHKPIETTVQHVSPATEPTDGAQTAYDYRLQNGDVLEVKFFYHPELNEEVTVAPDGKISLQLVDDVSIVGSTIPEARKKLTELYLNHIKSPTVSVILKTANNQQVYVGGEVKTPAAVPFNGKLTALQAVFQAGGLSPTAKTENIVVLRNQGTSTPLYITIDLRSDLEKPGQRHDINLQPQDIVYVPKTTIGKMDDFVDQYIDKLIPFSRSVGLFYDIGGRNNQ